MSDKKYIVSLLTYIFTISFLVFSVNAQSNFQATSGVNPGPICPGTTGLFSDTISNTGTSELQFTITNTGSSSSFTTTVPPGFIIGPGKTKTIYTYISPRTTTKVGRYTLDLNVATDEKTETISHTVDVKDCNFFEVINVNGQKSLCPTDIEKFDFSITNNGEYQDTYDLRLEGQIAPWVTLSENSITLAKGERKTVFAYVTTPSDSLGNYEFSLVTESRSTKRVNTAKASLVVNPCFDFRLSTKKDFVSLCENSLETIPIEIENQGSIDNIYNLNIDGPEWASLENNKLTIAKGQKNIVNLVVNPGYGISGDFKVDFKAVTEKGKIESSNQFNVNIKKCHNVEVHLEKNSDKICNSLSSTYNVIIKNTGEFEKEFKLELDAPQWAALERSSIILKPQEESQLSLTISPGFDTPTGNYDIKVKATALDTSKVSSEDILVINTISREECYKPTIGINNREIEVYYDSAATVPVVIENKGTLEATYDIGISGTAANFIHLNPAVVTIKPGMAEIVYLYISPTTETKDGSYSATVSVRLKDSTILESDTINIKVTQSKAGAVEEVKPEEIKKEPKKSLWQIIKELFTGAPKEEINKSVEILPLENETFTNITEITEETTPEEIIPEETIEVPSVNVENIDLDKLATKNIDIAKDLKHNLTIGNELHEVSLVNVNPNNDSVTIEIRSDPQTLDLKVGESKDIDTNSDGANDLRVTLVQIVNGIPQLKYEKITGAIVQEPIDEATVQEPNETETEILPPLLPSSTAPPETPVEKQSFFSLYKGFIIAGFVILIILILVIKYRKKIVDFFEEEIEEEAPAAKKEEKKEVKPVKKEEKKSPQKEPPSKKKKEVSEEEYY